MRADIFISYARDDDEPFVKQLYRDLTKHDFNVWWDRKAMESRGRTFLQEIRDAIEDSGRLIAVIGPNAVKSEYVHTEWEHALLFCKGVVPVLRSGDHSLIPPELSKLHCPDFRQEHLYKKALKELLRILAEPVPPLGPFLTIVPSLPPHFLPRPDDIARLGEAVLADVQRPTVITSAKQTTALQGMGGVGKSVLAAAFARAADTRRAFTDGIIWLTIGQEPGPLQNLRLLGLAFDDVRLPRVFADQVCLIVLDDVWQVAHAAPVINVLGPRCRLLITTRDGGLVTALGAQEHRLDVLSDDAALRLLADWSEQPVGILPAEARAVADECGNLPLALAMTGAMVRGKPNRWGNVLHKLRNADLENIRQQFPNYPYPDLLWVIQASVEALEPEVRARYLDFAVFPEDVPIPEFVLQTFWKPEGLDEYGAQDVVDLLVARSLVRRDKDGCFTLHDLQFDYVRKQASNLSALHNRLLNTYAALCDLSFIEAKYAAGPPSDLVAAYDFGLALEALPPAARRRIGEFARFVEAQSHLLVHYPALTFQQALNEPDSTAPAQAAQQRVVPGQEIRPHWCWINKPQSPSPCLKTFVGHSDIVNSCDVSPDGTRVVSASSDRELKIWNIANRRVLLTLRGHSESVETCAFSPDGRRIVSGARSGEVKLWDAVSGQELVPLVGHKDPVLGCAFGPDGKQIVSVSYDQTLKVWDVYTGAELHTLRGHGSLVSTCDFSPDGSRIVSGANDGSLKLWDARTGTELEPLAGHAKGVIACAFSADGTWIVSASADGTLKRWDATTGELLAIYTGHEGPVLAVAISPDGTKLISGAQGGSLMLWEVMTGRSLARLPGHTDEVWGLAFFPDGTRVVSASWDRTLKLWDVTAVASAPAQMLPAQESTGAKPLAGEAPSERSMITCSCSPDGTRFAAGSADGSLRLWDAATGSALGTFAVHQDYVIACTFSPDGKWILSGAWDGSLKLFDVIEQREGPALLGHASQIRFCAFSRDGTRIVSCSAESIQVWDVSPPDIQLRCAWQTEGEPFEACASAPDGQWIIAGFADGKIIMWDVALKKQVASFAGHEDFQYCALSPNGTHLVSASRDGTLKVWDVAKRVEITMLRGHTGSVVACNFSPDGKRVVSASWDHTLKVWEIANPKKPVTLVGHTGPLQDGCFSQDGRRILSACMDGTVRLWDAETGSQLGFLVSPANCVSSCTFSQDGTRIVSASHRWALKLWDGTKGTVQHILHGHAGEVCACVFSPDGMRLLSASSDKTLKLWDVAAGKAVATLEGHRGPVQTCTFSPDGRQIASGAWDKTVRLWNAETGAPLATLTGHEGWVQRVLFSPEGDRIVSCAQDRTLKVWEAASGMLLSTLFGHQDVVEACAFSPDGSRLVSGSGDGILKVWDVRRAVELFTLTGHAGASGDDPGAIRSCAFSPDGSQIVSASMDKTFKLWDAHNGQPRYTLSGHGGWVLACAFSPDGKRVLSGSEDRFLKLWDTATGKEMCEYWAGAAIQAVACHPQSEIFAVGDGIGQLHLLRLEAVSVDSIS